MRWTSSIHFLTIDFAGAMLVLEGVYLEVMKQFLSGVLVIAVMPWACFSFYKTLDSTEINVPS